MPPAGGDIHSVNVASILTAEERSRHMQSISVPPHDEEGQDHHEHHLFEDSGSLQDTDSPSTLVPPVTTYSKSYIVGLWIALGLAMLAIVAIAGFQVYSGIEKREDRHHSIQSVSGAVMDSSSTLALVTKQQERLHALDLSILKIQTDQADLNSTLQTEQTNFLTKLGKEHHARSISLCTSLLDTIQDTIPTKAAEQSHTEFVCQAQNGWQLTACPATAVVVQALLGRFTSAADGPCTDRGNAVSWQLESCPRSAEVTTATRQALRQAKGGPVLDTPMQLLQAGGLRADPCPRAYKQLQVTYKCPVGGVTKMDAPARVAKCEEIMAAAAAAPAVPVPQK